MWVSCGGRPVLVLDVMEACYDHACSLQVRGMALGCRAVAEHAETAEVLLMHNLWPPSCDTRQQGAQGPALHIFM